MRILVIKSHNTTPHLIEKIHIDKIKSLDKKLEVNLIPFNSKDFEKYFKNTDIIATIINVPSIRNAKNLKWIHSFSAGVDKLLTPEIINSNVIVTNSAGIHATPIAEHVLGFMLIFTRKFYETFQKQNMKIWSPNQDITELKGKTVLIVGLGHIGEEVARLANAFGAKTIGVKKNLNSKSKFVSNLYGLGQLEKALSYSDFVVLCLPLTNETRYLFNIEKFKKMKKSTVLINIGRGEVVKEKDLIKALDKKIIAGAALDVTGEEPLPQNSKLWEMENVVITPHHSGWSEKYMDRAIDLFCINLKSYLAGNPLPNLVDKKLGY